MNEKFLFILVISISSINAGIMEPDTDLKTTIEVIQEIDSFKESVAKKGDPYLHRLNNTKDYAEDMHKAERLTTGALWSYHLCDLHWRNKLDEWIDNYQSWDRDPPRFSNFKATNPENKQTEYSESLAKEKEKLISDSKECPSHQIKLTNHINDLERLVMYRKLREKL